MNPQKSLHILDNFTLINQDFTNGVIDNNQVQSTRSMRSSRANSCQFNIDRVRQYLMAKPAP